MVNCFRTSDMRAYATQHAQQLLEAAKGSASFSNAQVCARRMMVAHVTRGCGAVCAWRASA
eukprot:1638696-Rhodomonas_salina.1